MRCCGGRWKLKRFLEFEKQLRMNEVRRFYKTGNDLRGLITLLCSEDIQTFEHDLSKGISNVLKCYNS
jgi:hypothetical protein